MLIGVLSDTHDDMEQIAKAVKLFNERRVSLVLHAGDIVSPFTFEAFDALNAEFAGIYGNNDGDKLLLNEKSGGRVFNQPLIRRVNGRRIVVMHEPGLVEAAAKSGDFDVVIYGHLHKAEARLVGDVLVVNPGKTARLHRGQSTVAILDTTRMQAEIVGL